MAKEYLRRFTVCLIGLVLCGLGCAFGVQAGAAGTNAWGTLNIGLAGICGFSVGTASLIIGALVIGIDIIGKGKIGFGTLLNAVVVSLFTDVFVALFRLLPSSGSIAVGVVYSLLGQVILSFAMVLYMIPALGCGPRDTLMVIVGKKFPKAPIGAAKFGIDVFALIIGVLLGAPFGVGTVLVMALQAGIFQFACRVCRFEPRSVNHEDVADTVRRIRNGKGA